MLIGLRVFVVDVSSPSFRNLSSDSFHLRLAHAPPEPSWSLDRMIVFVLPSVLGCSFGLGYVP